MARRELGRDGGQPINLRNPSADIILPELIALANWKQCGAIIYNALDTNG